MEKNISVLVFIAAVLFLLSGFAIGRITGPEKVITNEIIKEVPTEVVKEVETIVEISTTDTKPLLDTAIADFLEEVEDVETCNDIEYDEDQIAVKKAYDEYSIVNLDSDDNEYKVIFKVKLKYLDEDVEEKCYNTYDVSVRYKEDKDPRVKILE